LRFYHKIPPWNEFSVDKHNIPGQIDANDMNCDTLLKHEMQILRKIETLFDSYLKKLKVIDSLNEIFQYYMEYLQNCTS
jgi:hypothetical protein